MKPTKQESAQTLKEFAEVMNRLEIPFCLFLGTALGAYRDGDFCPGDEDDIDVAIDIKYYDRLEEIRCEFNKLCWGVPPGYVAADMISPEHPVIKHHGDKTDPEYYTKVDMFFICGEEKKTWRFYLDDTGEKNLTKCFDKKHWDVWGGVRFYDSIYNIPGNIEEYLESNYGENWRTPIHRKDWDWSKDNKCYEKGLVSIIVPVWGGYSMYLDECLHSIREQTYTNYEVIVVEGIESLPAARNHGIKKSKGEYILCLDVDDKIYPQFLERTVGLGDIVTTSHIDQDGNVGMVSERVELSDFLEGNRIIAGSLFKREIWDKVGGYDEEMKDGYEDWDYNIRALKAGYKVTTVKEPLYFYRKHEGSMITKIKDSDDFEKKTREYVLNKHRI